ncbi:MAG: hypothetical protein ABI992_10065, partial [Chthoniobacterales bacterium]
LREPIWRIGMRRAQDFMLQLNVRSLTSSPALAMAVVVMAAVVSLKLVETPTIPEVAVATSPVSTRATGDSAWSLSTPVSTRSLDDAAVFRTVSENIPARRSAAPPRYVLDSTPVSYEASFRF